MWVHRIFQTQQMSMNSIMCPWAYFRQFLSKQQTLSSPTSRTLSQKCSLQVKTAYVQAILCSIAHPSWKSRIHPQDAATVTLTFWTMISLQFFLPFLRFYLFIRLIRKAEWQKGWGPEGQAGREGRERDVLSTGSVILACHIQGWVKLGDKNKESIRVSDVENKDPSFWTIICSCPKNISKKLNKKWNSSDLKWHTSKGGNNEMAA